MAKGGYMCISYPMDFPEGRNVLREIIDSIEQDGGAVAYILHDRDKFPDGSPKREHYHIICYWEKNPMPWNDVLASNGDIKRTGFNTWMGQHFCKAPDDYGNNSYDVAVVKDLDAALHYLLHEPI